MNDVYKSATLKLTAWYLTLLMAVSLIFSIVVYHFASHQLAQSLRAQTERIYEQFPVFSGNPFFVKNSDITNGSRHILFDLIYFNLLVLVIAGLASYWLARRTLKPIEASSERQKRFVADASHELRTPLTALKMDSEVSLMDDSLSKEELRETLRSNLEEANKLEGLMNNLLRLSQLESSDIQNKFTALKLSPILAEATEQVKHRAEAKHINIVNETKDEPIYGDQNSLVQLVVILMDNAIKYSPEKSTITLDSGSNQHHVTITITDQGIGIEPTELNHVFDRFFRADKARGGSSGYGIGLSIAKQIADLHKGTIILTSTRGKGTKASIELPKPQS